MVLRSCPCLNVKVHMAQKGLEKITDWKKSGLWNRSAGNSSDPSNTNTNNNNNTSTVKLDLPPLPTLFPNGSWKGTVDMGGIVVEYGKLAIGVKHAEGWLLLQCANCSTYVCAFPNNPKSQSTTAATAEAIDNATGSNPELADSNDILKQILDSRTEFVVNKSTLSAEEIENIRSSDKYSTVFQIVVRPEESADGGRPSSVLSPDSNEELQNLQLRMQQNLDKKKKEMDDRIREFVEEQNRLFEQSKLRANEERQILWQKILKTVSERSNESASLSSSISVSGNNHNANNNAEILGKFSKKLLDPSQSSVGSEFPSSAATSFVMPPPPHPTPVLSLDFDGRERYRASSFASDLTPSPAGPVPPTPNPTPIQTAEFGGRERASSTTQNTLGKVSKSLLSNSIQNDDSTEPVTLIPAMRLKRMDTSDMAAVIGDTSAPIPIFDLDGFEEDNTKYGSELSELEDTSQILEREAESSYDDEATLFGTSLPVDIPMKPSVVLTMESNNGNNKDKDLDPGSPPTPGSFEAPHVTIAKSYIEDSNYLLGERPSRRSILPPT